jgi:hypothetical protein
MTVEHKGKDQKLERVWNIRRQSRPARNPEISEINIRQFLKYNSVGLLPTPVKHAGFQSAFFLVDQKIAPG